MEQIKCKICDKEFTSLLGLSRHNSKKHSIPSEMRYIEYSLNGVMPTCECGCGSKPTFLSIVKGYNKFIRGHASRINNNWGHNSKAIKKSHATQRLMYRSGKLKIWNKGLTIDDPRVKDNIDKMMANPNRGKNISKALSNLPKTEEHKRKLSESQIKSWNNKEKRDRQRDNRINYIRNNNLIPISKLEKYFESILNDKFNLKCDVDYYPQFYVKEIRGLFDFKLSGKKILIEIDGDYWHCNPNSKFKIPKYAAQISNVKKDKIKKKWCNENNYQLIRFWEFDIKNNLDEVVARLKSLL